MVNYFRALLPVTTIVDDYLPGLLNRRFHRVYRFYIFGLHCAEWLKLFILLTLTVCIVISENVWLVYLRIRQSIVNSGQTYHGLDDIIYEWDYFGFNYYLVAITGPMLGMSALFLLTIITGIGHFLLPMQIYLLTYFNYYLHVWMNLSGRNYEEFAKITRQLDAGEPYRREIEFAEEMLRDDWMPIHVDLQEYHEDIRPLIRNIMLFTLMYGILALEYCLERTMQFYWYDRFLWYLNRPVIIAYRKWQFRKMMLRRRAHQKARLVRRHQNVNGNYTWNCEARNWSMHTAIDMDDDDGDSLRTAVELDENESAYKLMIARREALANRNRSCKF